MVKTLLSYEQIHIFITHKRPFTNDLPLDKPPVHSRNSVGLSFTLSPTALSLSYPLFFPPPFSIFLLQLSSPSFLPPHSHLNTLLIFKIFSDLPFHFLALVSFTFILNVKVIHFVLRHLTHIYLSPHCVSSHLPLLSCFSFLCFCCFILFFPTVCFKIKFLPQLCCFSLRWALWQTVEVLNPEAQEVQGYQGVSRFPSQIEGLAGCRKTKGPASSAGSWDMDHKWGVGLVVCTNRKWSKAWLGLYQCVCNFKQMHWCGPVKNHAKTSFGCRFLLPKFAATFELTLIQLRLLLIQKVWI